MNVLTKRGGILVAGLTMMVLAPLAAQAYYGSPWTAGRVDCDIDPEKAEVYIEGRRLGTADDFDGFPDYLYLQPGSYTLEFRHVGYVPLTLKITVKPHQLIRLDNRMQQGASSEAPQSHPEPEAPPLLLQPQTQAENQEAPLAEESWTQEEPAVRTDSNGNWSYLVIRCEPADAVVYVDDEFLGKAGDFDGVIGRAVLSPGVHSLVVSRPDYETLSLSIKIATGSEQTVDLTLTRKE